MASYNRVILMGNLTRDVEVRYVGNNMAVTDIGLAVNDRRKNPQTGEWIEDTTFVDITLWGRTAEIAAEYLSKGSPVFIEGRLKLDQWESEGQKRSKLKVVGEKLQFISGRGPAGEGGGSSSGSGASTGGSRGQQDDAMEAAHSAMPGGDDIPF
ncbi:MAG: single-stranded DNA-binding protein [Pirellulaceae bacterium]|nr:single-stranded DNA-binding protein [Planctomycetales bacterium]